MTGASSAPWWVARFAKAVCESATFMSSPRQSPPQAARKVRKSRTIPIQRIVRAAPVAMPTVSPTNQASPSGKPSQT